MADADYTAGTTGDKDDARTGDRKALDQADALFARLKRQCKGDYDSAGQVKWRKEAREDFDFRGRRATD
jgi:hypothetical protein